MAGMTIDTPSKLIGAPRFRVLLLGTALALFSSTAAVANTCKLAKIADLPVKLENNHVYVEGSINGRTMDIMLDTGAMRSLMPRSAATRLGLSRQQTSAKTFGVGGSTVMEVVSIDEFKIGGATRRGWRVYTAGERDFGASVGFILGEDFFSQLDVEFDLAHKAVRLFQPKDCSGVSLAYWSPTDYSAVEIERVDDFHPQIVLTALINDQPVDVLLDSGAGTSVVIKSAAGRVGVTPETPGVTAVGKSVGFGPNAVDSWIGPFKSFLIGNEKISDTSIRFADLFGTPGPHEHSMLLGADFFLAHRVFIAHSQRKVYFTYASGPVFQLTGPLTIRDRPSLEADDSSSTSGPAPVERPVSKSDSDTAAAPQSLRDSLMALIALGVPAMSASVRENRVSDYESKQDHKAIALAPSRGTWWRFTNNTSAIEESTLEGCQVYYGQPCAILAINDKIVADTSGNWQLRDMARVRYSGSFDPERIPVSWAGLKDNPSLAKYRAAQGPKALVFHPSGYLYWQWGAPDQYTAEQRAFDRCNNDPPRNGRDPPCYLYAVGDQVVLSKRQSKPTPKPER
jgi:predicted aspartyl protease